MAVTPRFMTGFSHGIVGQSPVGMWDSATAGFSVVTSPVFGAHTHSLQMSSDAVVSIGRNIVPGGTFPIVTLSFRIRWATLPNEDIEIAHVLGALGNGYLRFVSSTNQIAIRTDTGTFTAGGPTLSANNWYHVVAEWDYTTASWVARCSVDGGSTFQDTETGGGASQWDTALIGSALVDPVNSHTTFYSGFVVSVTDGDFEQMRDDWASYDIQSLIPNADGTHNIGASGDFDDPITATNFSNSTTNGNTHINHRPFDSGATELIEQGGGTTPDTRYMEFLNEDLSAGRKVLSVSTDAACRDTSAIGTNIGVSRLLLSDNTVIVDAGGLEPWDVADDPGNAANVLARVMVAPSGGWNTAKVNGLKWRIGFSDTTPVRQWNDLMVEVLSLSEPSSLAPIHSMSPVRW